MTEEGKNVVKEFMALKENEKKLNNNQIELDNYFNDSGKIEEINDIIRKEIEFQKKAKASSILYQIINYSKKYIPNPKRVNPKRKLKK